MKLRYYQDPNGDYLCIDLDSNRHYQTHYHYEGRSTAIKNDITSICTGTISGGFLSGCKQVKVTDVPKEWLAAFFPEE